jgi:hypothetical protein
MLIETDVHRRHPGGAIDRPLTTGINIPSGHQRDQTNSAWTWSAVFRSCSKLTWLLTSMSADQLKTARQIVKSRVNGWASTGGRARRAAVSWSSYQAERLQQASMRSKLPVLKFIDSQRYAEGRIAHRDACVD